MRTFLSTLAFVALAAVAPAAFADEHADEDAPSHEHADRGPATHGKKGPHAEHAQHGAKAGHAEHAEHAEHAAHGGHHVPTFDDINWFYGWFGEKEGVEPDLMFRPKGMPAPFGMWILNAALLYGFLIRVSKKPLAKALKDRKTTILRGMDEAQRMKRDAEKRLADYEAKLERIEEEVERVRREMREGAHAEREKILADARARRERMEKDAQLLVAQEFVAARETVKVEMVTAAMGSAGAVVRTRLRADDQQRLADEYLAGLGKAKSLGGRA